jgi:Flp pilus assembly pilin Flp
MTFRRSRGQAAIEYAVVLVLVVGILFAVPDGVVDRVVVAIADAYARFTEGVSRP